MFGRRILVEDSRRRNNWELNSITSKTIVMICLDLIEIVMLSNVTKEVSLPWLRSYAMKQNSPRFLNLKNHTKPKTGTPKQKVYVMLA